jgi:hypothetical protein
LFQSWHLRYQVVLTDLQVPAFCLDL